MLSDLNMNEKEQDSMRGTESFQDRMKRNVIERIRYLIIKYYSKQSDMIDRRL